MSLKKQLFSLYNLIPPLLRGRLSRRFFKFHYKTEFLEGVEFKIADTEDEIGQAFQLVQNEYEKKGLVENEFSGMRLTKYNLLPSTIIFIAKKDEKVIGTVSLIIDTNLGLPADFLADLSELRRHGERLGEISSLAVDRNWVRKNNFVFLGLVLWCSKYSYEVIGCRYNLAVTNKNVGIYYQDLFLFKPLKKKKESYEYVNDPNASAQYLDLKNDLEIFSQMYNKNVETNILYYLRNPPWKNQIKNPHLRSKIVSQKRIGRDLFHELIKLNKKILKDLTLEDYVTIENLIYGKDVNWMQTNSLINDVFYQRESERILTKIPASIYLESETIQSICYDISKAGLNLKLQREVELGDVIKIKLEYFDQEWITLEGKVSWKNNGRIGFRIALDDQKKWEEIYLMYLNEYLLSEKDLAKKAA